MRSPFQCRLDLLLESAVAQRIVTVGGSANVIQLLFIDVHLEQRPVVLALGRFGSAKPAVFIVRRD